MLIEQLLEEVPEKYHAILERINFGVRLMQLLVLNLVDFQMLKYDSLVVQESPFDIKNAIKEIISVHEIVAK